MKQVSPLVKFTGTRNTFTPVAGAGGGRYEDDIDQELLKQLKHPKLLELYGEFLNWGPKPDFATRHISFMKHLSLLVHFQKHRMFRVVENINKSLFHWNCNQKNVRISSDKGGKFHINNRYVRYLRKVGGTVEVKVEEEDKVVKNR